MFVHILFIFLFIIISVKQREQRTNERNFKQMEMNDVITSLESMTEETREEFYKELEKQGFSVDEIFAIKSVLFYKKLFTNKQFYNAVETAVREQFIKSINAE